MYTADDNTQKKDAKVTKAADVLQRAEVDPYFCECFNLSFSRAQPELLPCLYSTIRRYLHPTRSRCRYCAIALVQRSMESTGIDGPGATSTVGVKGSPLIPDNLTRYWRAAAQVALLTDTTREDLEHLATGNQPGPIFMGGAQQVDRMTAAGAPAKRVAKTEGTGLSGPGSDLCCALGLKGSRLPRTGQDRTRAMTSEVGLNHKDQCTWRY